MHRLAPFGRPRRPRQVLSRCSSLSDQAASDGSWAGGGTGSAGGQPRSSLADGPLGLLDHPGQRTVDFGIAQGASSILHPYPEGKAFLLIFQSLTAIFVEKPDVFHGLRKRRFIDSARRIRSSICCADTTSWTTTSEVADRPAGTWTVPAPRGSGSARAAARDRARRQIGATGRSSACWIAGCRLPSQPIDDAIDQPIRALRPGCSAEDVVALETQHAARVQRLDVALQVEEVDRPFGHAPLLVGCRAVGQQREP